MSKDKSTKNESENVDVQTPKEAGEKASEQVKKTNQSVESAAAEAAKRLEARVSDDPEAPAPKERFNITDIVLGETDHGKKVKEAQKATIESFDGSVVVPAHSQNVNNQKHPETVEANDPHLARNYLGQPI